MQIVCPLLLYSLLQSCEDSTLLPILHKKQNKTDFLLMHSVQLILGLKAGVLQDVAFLILFMLVC